MNKAERVSSSSLQAEDDLTNGDDSFSERPSSFNGRDSRPTSATGSFTDTSSLRDQHDTAANLARKSSRNQYPSPNESTSSTRPTLPVLPTVMGGGWSDGINYFPPPAAYSPAMATQWPLPDDVMKQAALNSYYSMMGPQPQLPFGGHMGRPFLPLGAGMGSIQDLLWRQHVPLPQALSQQLVLPTVAQQLQQTQYFTRQGNQVLPDLSSTWQSSLHSRASRPGPNGPDSMVQSQIQGRMSVSDYTNDSSSFQGSQDAASQASETGEATKKPPDIPKPKRPLTAYNLFFKDKRAEMIEQQRRRSLVPSSEGGSSKDCTRNKKSAGVSFEEMARTIAKQWKGIDEKTKSAYEARAKEDKLRYTDQISQYRNARSYELEAKRSLMEATVSDEVKRQYFSSKPPNKKAKRSRSK